MAHQTANLQHRELLLCLLTHKIGDPFSLLYFSVVCCIFSLQVVSIYMTFLVTIKGNRRNCLKRHMKSKNKNQALCFIFCNNLFFSDISKRKGVCRQLGCCQRSEVCQFGFFFFSISDDVYRLREKCQALPQFPRAWRAVCLESGAEFRFSQISLMPHAGYSIFDTQQKHLQNN